MRFIVRTQDAASFLRALSITARQAEGAHEAPERNLLMVDHLPDETVRRLETMGAEVDRIQTVPRPLRTPAAVAVAAGF
jgi:hypothetical protein